MRTVKTIIATLAAVMILFFAFIMTGWYNIAATDHHTFLTLWVLDLALDRSVAHHSAGIQAPAFLQDSTVILAGARLYQHNCRGCHGAPGIKPGAVGMYPRPPELSKEADDWTPPQFFWIVKHGLKMSGMPAFNDRRNDDEIWAITAFASVLPKLTPEQYQAMSAEPDTTAHSERPH
jgi:cytochrome c553